MTKKLRNKRVCIMCKGIFFCALHKYKGYNCQTFRTLRQGDCVCSSCMREEALRKCKSCFQLSSSRRLDEKERLAFFWDLVLKGRKGR